MTETENLVLEQLRLMRKEIAEIKEGLAGVHVEIIDAQERRGLEKLRTEIEMDLARRHNWAAQAAPGAEVRRAKLLHRYRRYRCLG